MEEMTFNISYSLLSKFKEHLSGAMCGYRFEQQYLRKQFEEPQGEAAAAGQWAEFIATGALPRDGKEPQPKRTKAGELTAMYKHLQNQIDVNFKAIYQDIEITEKGKEIILNYEGYRFKMILDVVSVKGFITQIRDIKTSGMVGNEWEPTGWAHTFKRPLWDRPQVLQAKIYIWSWWKTYGEIPEFFYDVFANNNPDNFEVFEIRMNEISLIQFEEQLLELCRALKVKSQIQGFEPLPDFKRCRDCKECTNKKGETLYNLCPHKSTKINPIVVNIP